jgi:uncharacterized repeat protein (TIGR01451 family)/MYXO-CTERM domain-containing protein
MHAASCNLRTILIKLVLRGSLMAIGVLVGALLTAAAASAQTADLAISSNVSSPEPVAAGSFLLIYAVTVTNHGPDPALNVVVTNAPPPNTKLASIITSGGWNGEFVGAIRPVGVARIASLAAGATATLVFGMEVNSDVPAGTVFTDTATITSTTVDPNVANNAGTATTSINPGVITPAAVADLVVTKSGPVGPLPAGQTVTYTFTVTNNGPSAVANAALVDTTPPDTTFVSVVQNTGPPFTCTSPSAGGVGAVHCGIASLGAGAAATFVMTVQITAGTPNGITLPNLATFASNTTDTTATNNTSSATTLVGPLPTSTLMPSATITPAVTVTPTTTRTTTATATPTCILGDINCDGIVDIRDYGLWRQHFGESAGAAAPSRGVAAVLIGDINEDGIVDIRDYGLWRLHFGEGTPADRRGSGPMPGGMVPAPRSGAVLRAEDSELAVPVIPLVGGLLGLGGLAGWRRRRPPSARE